MRNFGDNLTAEEIISRRISKPEGLHKGLFRYFFVLFGAAFVISFLISQYSEFVNSGAGFSPLALFLFAGNNSWTNFDADGGYFDNCPEILHHVT